jgi:Flp pilus assembly protein TadD
MQAAADRAIELDPLLAEAHEAEALAHARMGQWDLAERSFRRAIELDPNRSSTRASFALWLLWVVGRNREALEQLRTAEKADPLSPEVQADLGLVLISVRRYEEALDHCQKMSSDNEMRGRCIVRIQLGKGRLADAVPFLAQGAPRDPEMRGFLGYVQALSGRRDEAERLVASAEYPNEQALIFAGLRDGDRALQALDRMAMLGPQRIGMYLNYPEFALLRGDPRVTVLRKKVGLPE